MGEGGIHHLIIDLLHHAGAFGGLDELRGGDDLSLFVHHPAQYLVTADTAVHDRYDRLEVGRLGHAADQL